MKYLYLDCFAGISGDMFVGALLDLGIDIELLIEKLKVIPLENYEVSAKNTSKNGITGIKFDVKTIVAEHNHRHLKDIYQLINSSGLSDTVKNKSREIFLQLAEAEAKIHGCGIEQVHFHEVGAIDSIIDIVSVLICLEELKIDKIICSPLPVGSGFVKCEHGLIPVPAPATLELLKNIPIADTDIKGETVTPTGAVLVSNLADSFGTLPGGYVEKIGYGAGSRDNLHIPNLLRSVIYCEGKTTFFNDKVWTVTSNIDDMNPEFFDHVISRVFKAGALDVSISSILMKKNRPAHQLTVMCYEDCLHSVADTILKETTSLGLRFREDYRYILKRYSETVETKFGQLPIKIGACPNTGEILNVAPEWDECLKTAARLNIPAKVIYDHAKSAAINKISIK